jgi:hypothetical protein
MKLTSTPQAWPLSVCHINARSRSHSRASASNPAASKERISSSYTWCKMLRQSLISPAVSLPQRPHQTRLPGRCAPAAPCPRRPPPSCPLSSCPPSAAAKAARYRGLGQQGVSYQLQMPIRVAEHPSSSPSFCRPSAAAMQLSSGGQAARVGDLRTCHDCTLLLALFHVVLLRLQHCTDKSMSCGLLQPKSRTCCGFFEVLQMI